MSAQDHDTTRRAVVAGLAAAPVAGVASFASAIPLSPPADLDALWAEFVALGPKILDARSQVAAATQAMPAWAKPGSKYITRDGVYDGEIVGEPMDVTVTPPEVGSFSIVRMSLADATREYKFAQNWVGATRAKKDYVAELRRLARLRMLQRVEMQKVGLPELERSREALICRQYDAANAIFVIEDHSANAVAAKIIIAAFYDWMDPGPIDLDVLENFTPALIALLPGLTGQIAVDVAELRAKWEGQATRTARAAGESLAVSSSVLMFG
jgi:hypothetical protein